MKKYPVTIDNGHGEELTFVGIEIKDGVEYMIVDNIVTPNSGPPMHVHHKQHEELTIVEGVMGTQVLGEAPQYHKAGATLLFEAGVAHKFWNAGDTLLKCTGRVWPVNNLEYFLTEIYKSTKASKNHRPSLMDTAFLLRRYKSEFDMMEIPPFVKKALLPVAYFIGNLTGAFKKFKDAP
jgi:quercetin dioxygenase-like cupin family protein